MEDTHLEDAEALRLLLEDTTALATDAQRLAELVGRLTHTARHFVESYLAGQSGDPRGLLLEMGAVLERCLAVELGRVGLEDVLGSLRVRFVPNPAPHGVIQLRALVGLRLRLVRGGHPLRRHRRPGPPELP